jgi:putative nucleotidyltransferase with HDIG domain
MSTVTDSVQSAPYRIQRLLRSSLLWLVTLLLGAGLSVILVFNLVTGPQVSATLGEPASQDVQAPQSISFVSQVATARQQANAAAAVNTVYQPPDLSIGRAERNRAQAIFNFIDAVRSDAIASEGLKTGYLQGIDGITVEPQVAADILAFTPSEFTAVKDDILRIVEEVMREEIREEDVSSARRAARRQISFFLTTAQERVVTSLAPQFVIANTFPDEAATELRREEAIAAVQPVERTVTRDERIIRVGEVIDEEDIETLQVLGLLQREIDWPGVVSAVMAALLSVTLLVAYWHLFGDARYKTSRYLLILTLMLLSFVLAAKFMMPGRTPLAYIFPAAAMAMMLSVVFDVRLSMIAAIVLAALSGYIAGNSLELTVYHAIGGLIAVLTLRDVQRINDFFRAGLVAALAQMAVLAIFRMPQDLATSESLQLLGWALANGILSAGLTLAGLFVLGSVFGIITTLQLQELARLDHPLLQELLRRAPGTYHHSIMVANLAEQAAEQVRANGTLVRVGAFYHDVGKMNRPPFFTENQAGINPHDSLDPYSSARIIISHVTDGLTLARQYRLPDRIRDFIAQHHGDHVVATFYHRAVELAGGDEGEVAIERFRYPGPRPQSRESGILMLADSVEAASSALQPDAESEIEKLVNGIVDGHVKAGQLDESGLTLGEVQAIRTSLINTLKGRFHVRVRYPGNEQMMAEEPREEPVTAELAAEVAREHGGGDGAGLGEADVEEATEEIAETTMVARDGS